MKFDLTRRDFLAATGAAALPLSPAFGQGASNGQGLLEKLRKDGIARVGIVNGLPYSSLNPDGTLGGVAPTITGIVLQRLGIPKMEGLAAPYGQMIPGLQAGRWDFIAAALTITKARCEQVTYCDPFLIDGAAFAYLPADMPNPPKSFAEAGARLDRVGMLTGAATIPLMQRAADAGQHTTIMQVPDTPALIEALNTKRIPLGITGILSLRKIQEARNGAFQIVYPLADDFAHASGPAFRPADTDLSNAFRAEYRKMRASGEAQKIIRSFGFSVDDHFLSAEEACSRSA